MAVVIQVRAEHGVRGVVAAVRDGGKRLARHGQRCVGGGWLRAVPSRLPLRAWWGGVGAPPRSLVDGGRGNAHPAGLFCSS